MNWHLTLTHLEHLTLTRDGVMAGWRDGQLERWSDGVMDGYFNCILKCCDFAFLYVFPPFSESEA